jgi:hypothetical protein
MPTNKRKRYLKKGQETRKLGRLITKYEDHLEEQRSPTRMVDAALELEEVKRTRAVPYIPIEGAGLVDKAPKAEQIQAVLDRLRSV